MSQRENEGRAVREPIAQLPSLAADAMEAPEDLARHRLADNQDVAIGVHQFLVSGIVALVSIGCV